MKELMIDEMIEGMIEDFFPLSILNDEAWTHNRVFLTWRTLVSVASPSWALDRCLG